MKQRGYTTNAGSDPYATTWTDEQKTRKKLQDAQINRSNLEASFVGMPTTEVVVKLGAFDDEIAQLSQELGVTDSASVPTMTEPIPEYSQPEEQSGNSDPDAIQEPQTPVYTNPYDIPWTDEQEKRKRLSDATIERDNLQKSFVGMPTTEVVVKLGEYDDEIKKLTQELGVGDSVANAPLGQGFVDDVVDQAGAGALGYTDSGGAPGGGGGGSWGEASTYISQKDYDTQLKQTNDEQALIDQAMIEIEMYGIDNPEYNYVAYQPEMGSYSDLLDKKIENDKHIEELKNQRTESAKTDPLFNTTGIITSQNTLGSMPYGSKGTAAGNSCGAVAAHNSLILLGENSNFVDVYTYFNDDSKLVLGGLAGGKLGSDPFAVAEYLESKGHEVTFKDFKTEELETPGTYILVYGWQVGLNISAHFQTVESDGSLAKTYNGDEMYYVGDTNKTGFPNIGSTEQLKSDTDMIEIGKSWVSFLGNPVDQLFKKLKDDDTNFSYIMVIE